MAKTHERSKEDGKRAGRSKEKRETQPILPPAVAFESVASTFLDYVCMYLHSYVVGRRKKNRERNKEELEFIAAFPVDRCKRTPFCRPAGGKPVCIAIHVSIDLVLTHVAIYCTR